MILREGQEVCEGHPASALPGISPETRMKHQKKTLSGHDLSSYPQTGNPGPVWAYLPRKRGFMTGLNRAFLNTFFPITGIRAQNPKQTMLLSGKPASLNPFVWPIVVIRELRSVEWEKDLFWGIRIFGIRDGVGCIPVVIKSPHFGLVLAKGEDEDSGRSQEIANYRSLFLRSRIIRVFWRNWLDYEPEKLP